MDMSLHQYNYDSNFNLTNEKINEKYEQKFKNIETKKSGFIKKISSYMKHKNEDLKFNTHVTAQHMSDGSLSGNTSKIACSKTVELLEKIENPSEHITKATDALKYAESILGKVNHIFFTPPYKKIAEKMKGDIGSLQKGESKAIPSDSEGHSTMMLITCTSDIPKTFTIEQHNTGYGKKKYHYYRDLPSGKREYQTTLQIKGISYENLCGPNSTFFYDLLQSGQKDISVLYEKIIPKLNGTIAPPSEDPRLWSDGQMGGACTARCNLSVIRSLVDKNEYKQVMVTARLEMLLKVYTQMQNGKYTPFIEKVVALDAIAKLERSYEKRRLAVPKKIIDLKTNLEEKVKSSTMSEKTLSKIKLNSVEDAYYVLRKANFNAAAISKVEQYLKETAKAENNYNTQEMLDLLKVMKQDCDNRIFNENQIYILSALSARILDYAGFQSDLYDPKKPHPVYSYALEMLEKFIKLELYTKDNLLNDDIGGKIKKYFRPIIGPQIPDEMQKMMNNISKP